MTPLGQRLAAALESRALDGAVTRPLSRLWARVASPVRPLSLPAGVAVVGVGGATLGGAGKTPLVAALAQQLAQRGVRVAVVASGYPARIGDVLEVTRGHDVERVGDEALWLARELDEHDVRVVVGRRQAAVDRAAQLASVVIVDGLLQCAPRRLSLSLLVLDASVPFLTARCPPAGDLRADRERLAAAADRVVVVGDASRELEHWVAAHELTMSPARRQLRGVRLDGRCRALDELRGLRVGVCLAIAHPERVLGLLASRGIEPVAIALARDHAVPRPTADRVDVWLCTEKCALKLPASVRGVPIAALVEHFSVDNSLISKVISLCPGAALAT